MLKFLTKTIRQFKNATLYSCAGLGCAFKEEFAFKLEVLSGFIALPLALFIGQSAIERCLLSTSFLLILIVELVNSAIETTLNRMDHSWHPLTKKAKDLGSAAVMLSIANALIVWVMILI
jgi:diacylglycerol kinase (ATP)